MGDAQSQKYYSSATALFEQIFKKLVKSILGRHMWFENNPEITHGEIAWVLQKNKDDGMQHDND